MSLSPRIWKCVHCNIHIRYHLDDRLIEASYCLDRYSIENDNGLPKEFSGLVMIRTTGEVYFMDSQTVLFINYQERIL